MLDKKKICDKPFQKINNPIYYTKFLKNKYDRQEPRTIQQYRLLTSDSHVKDLTGLNVFVNPQYVTWNWDVLAQY